MKTVGEILTLLKMQFEIEKHGGDINRKCIDFKKLSEAGPESICFADVKFRDEVKGLKCGVILLNYIPDQGFESPYIVLKNPRRAFIYLMNELTHRSIVWGIHPSAQIHAAAQIDPEVYIGPNCVIGNSKISKGAILAGNICVADQVEIGENVEIGFGCVLGSDGLGFERDIETGELNFFPHVGNLVIGKNTKIYTNVTIARGTLGATTIGAGCAIDCFTKIGHNVSIGDNVSIASHSIVGGSSSIGANSSLYMNVTVYDKISIGAGCHIGPGAIIMLNMADKTKTTARPNNINLT